MRHGNTCSRPGFRTTHLRSRGASRKLQQSPDKSAREEDEISRLRRELVTVTKKIYGNLTPWETVQVARHKDRPHTTDYLALMFDEFVELHGDKHFGDDRAIRTRLRQARPLQGHGRRPPKGPHLQGTERLLLRLRPSRRLSQGDGQDAAGRQVPLAGDLPSSTRPARIPGIGAEERGQAQVIAENMFEMSRLQTPDHLRRHRRRRQRRRAGHRRRRSRGHARARLLLGDQPRRLRRHPLEEPRLRGAGRPGAAVHRPRIC